MRKVAVGLSGGVDSSVSALLLKEEGFDVVGITLKLSETDICSSDIQVCCSTKDILDAKKVANFLGIPHFVIDWQDIFKEKVIGYFKDEYLGGKTPNPCAICNRDVKTGLLANYVKKVLKADFLATGHYIRTRELDGIGKVLVRGKDINKDQSYFLSLIPKDVVSMLLFPVGDLEKEEVRKIANGYNLPVSGKKDSFEICFTAGKEPYDFFVEKGIVMEKGEIVHIKSNRVLGEHKGLPAYTVGQRRGLSVAWKEPLYVVDKDREKNIVYVGERDFLLSDRVKVRDFNLLVDVSFWREIKVQGRYRQKPVDVKEFVYDNGFLDIRLANPEPKFASGQVLAVYQNDILLGGGIIV